jgi:small neutral amino acid transporter SnatA (MarC family)
VTGTLWLMAAGVVIASNPARVHDRLPARQVAIVGASLTAAAYLALAGIAGGLLEAIDVSAPTMGVAAGLVLIAGGVRDLLAGPPSAEPALPGWGAALVPVALPMLARPHVGVLALSVGASDGIGPVLAGGALLVAVVAWLAVLGDRRTVVARIVGWLAVTAAVGTMVLGVALAVDGVMQV